MRTKVGFDLPRPRAAVEYAEWRIVQIIDVHDGDTLTVLREHEVYLSEWLAVKTYDRKPVKLRLTGLDTPEINSKDSAELGRAIKAREDLCIWIGTHREAGLGCTVLGDGGFSRILADLHTLEPVPQSASAWMREQGWPTWIKGK